jgi:putative transposase
MLAFAAERIMELEVEARTGAAKGARSPLREVRRNGYRDRDWDTRAGRIALETPKLRKGSYFPERPRAAPDGREGARGARHCFSDPWRSNGSLQEAYVHGVSTQSVDDPVKAMGAGGVSKSQVSRLCVEIDERVNAFLSRPLEGDWPYLWLDATHLKVREGGRILSRAVIIAVAVNDDGKREGEPLMRHWFKHNGERRRHRAFGSRDLLDGLASRSLADRGLRGVMLVIADDHRRLRAAARTVFNATHQRCRIHRMRNALARAPAKQRVAVAAMLKTIFAQESKADAEAQWDTVADAARARRTRSSASSWTPPGMTSSAACPSRASTGLRSPARTHSNG